MKPNSHYLTCVYRQITYAHFQMRTFSVETVPVYYY